jgi:hypothetical protein
MRLPAYIDDEGEIWPEDSIVLARRLNTCRSGRDLRRVATEHLGYIHLSRTGRFVRVCLSRRTVSDEAAAGLLYWMSQNRDTAFLVEENAGSAPPHLTLAPNYEAMIGFVAALCGAEDRRSYVEHDVPLERTAFADRWQAAREVVSSFGTSAKTGSVLDALFRGHWTISEFDDAAGEFRFSRLGAWYSTFDTGLSRKLIGQSPLAFGDSALGSHVQRSTARFATAHEPATQRVSTMLRWGGQQARHVDYTRLLVPLSRGAGRRLLISAAVVH